MKTLIKYLSLLIFSGLIIPLYLQIHTPDGLPAKAVRVFTSVQKPIQDDVYHFSFITDIAEKLIPAIKNLR